MRFLTEREELVLRTIIDEYVTSNEPIGSRNVSRVGPLKMSPATIRNIMSDLVDLGYIVQPHTSSGRVPTDNGYRYYIDKLVSMHSLSAELLEKVQKEMNFDPINVMNLFKTISKKLGDMTGSIGFIVSPKTNAIYLKHIEFVRLNKESILAILVAKTGLVQNILIPATDEITPDDLTKMSNYINENFSNRAMSEIRMHLLDELVHEKGEIDNLIKKSKPINLALFANNIFEEEIIFSGTTNLLDQPELQNTHKLQDILKTFDEKRMITQLFDSCMREDTVQIFVGSEIGLKDIDEMGMVIKPYQRGGNIIGTMGVIGPKRMRYSQVASIVDYSAQIMSRMLTDFYGGDDE